MNKVIPFFLPHGGCPHRCVFCHQPHITGVAEEHQLTPEAVRQTIETVLAEPKSRKKHVRFEAAFYGGTFTGLDRLQQKMLLRTVQPYVDRGELQGIRLSTRPGRVYDDGLSLLEAFSVTMVEVGVQSFDDEVLRLSGRGHTAEDAVRTIQAVLQRGMKVGIHLMVGLPGDSSATSLLSAERSLELQPDSVRIHPTLVIRGTALETLYRKGLYVPLSLDAAVTTCKKMVTRFRRSDIPVIRIGLQPTDSMAAHLVAGPYHPAFRQLVESEMLYDQMVELWQSARFQGQSVTFYVAPQDVSTARGQKNRNIDAFQRQFGLNQVDILSDPDLERGHIRIS